MFDWVLNVRPCIIWQKRFQEGCAHKAETLNKKSEKKVLHKLVPTKDLHLTINESIFKLSSNIQDRAFSESN